MIMTTVTGASSKHPGSNHQGHALTYSAQKIPLKQGRRAFCSLEQRAAKQHATLSTGIRTS